MENEPENWLECQDCGWTGDHTELVALTDNTDDLDFQYCPMCDSGNIEDAV